MQVFSHIGPQMLMIITGRQQRPLPMWAPNSGVYVAYILSLTVSKWGSSLP